MHYLVILSIFCSTMSYGMQLARMKSSSFLSAIVGQRSTSSSLDALCQQKKTGIVMQRHFFKANSKKSQIALYDLAVTRQFNALAAQLDNRTSLCAQEKADLCEILAFGRQLAQEELKEHQQKSKTLFFNGSASFVLLTSFGPLAKATLSTTRFLSEMGREDAAIGAAVVGGCMLVCITGGGVTCAQKAGKILFDNEFGPDKDGWLEQQIKIMDDLRNKIESLDTDPK